MISQSALLLNNRMGNFKLALTYRGITKKINGELKQRSLERGEARLLIPKRFFLSAKSLIKSPERHEEAFLLVSNRDRLIKGRMERCLV